MAKITDPWGTTTKFQLKFSNFKNWLRSEAGDFVVLILACIIWVVLHAIRHTSGLKIVVNKETEWTDQMTWGPLI